MNNSSSPNMADFSLTDSGVFYKLLQKLGLGRSTKRDYVVRSLVVSCVTWIPLLILTMMQGLAFGNLVEGSFIKVIATHVRFLLIIPLLIFAEISVDGRIRELTIQFFRSGILTEQDHSKFEEIKKSTSRLTKSVHVDIVILAAIVILMSTRWKFAHDNLSYWVVDPVSGRLSWAGIWNVFVSLPLFQFIMVRWLWRWICWLYYFAKMSKLPLKLNPAHPDLAGGLGFLGLPPSPFMSINFALAALCSSVAAGRILFLGQHLADFYVILGALLLITILMNILPLLVFMPSLMAARRKGIFEYSALVQKHHRKFDETILQPENEEPLVGHPAASSMTDFNSSFDTVMKMRIFPFDIKIMASTIIVMVLPALPLFAFEYDLADTLKKLAGLLF